MKFEDKRIQSLWKASDDAIQRIVYLDDLYDNVPKKLKSVPIEIYEFHFIKGDKKLKKEVLNWLNKEGK